VLSIYCIILYDIRKINVLKALYQQSPR